MSYHNENGGCAFPVSLEWAGPSKSPFTGEPIADGHTEQFASIGMSLRDYFAAKAMQALLSNPKLADRIVKEGGAFGGWIEESAWAWADGMLKARRAK